MCNNLQRLVRRLPILVLILELSSDCLAGVKIELVSKAATNAPITRGDSLGAVLSPDGKWALVTSSAENLPRENLSEPSLDVFLKNVETGDTKLISRSLDGHAGNGPSIAIALSTEGRYALFASEASNLIAADNNGASDLFLYDRAADVLTPVSSNGDVIGNGETTEGTMTPDGRFTLFQSRASNLDVKDTNGVTDLFLFDRADRSLKTVTSGFVDGFPKPVFDASVSPDGRYVAFLSYGTNPSIISPAGPYDLQAYVRDFSSGALYWISGQQDRRASYLVSDLHVTTNGYALFVSSDLIAGAANGDADTYVHRVQLEPRVVARVPDPVDVPATERREVVELAASQDGRYAAYILEHHTQTSPVYRQYAVYLFDFAENRQQLITTNGTGPASGRFHELAMSDDGRIITFLGTSADVLPTGDGASEQLYRFDRTTGQTSLLSRANASSAWAEDVLEPALSADGSIAAFVSRSSPDDNAGTTRYDVYTVNTSGDEVPAPLTLPFTDTESATAAGATRLPFVETDLLSKRTGLSTDGRIVFLHSTAGNILRTGQRSPSGFYVNDLTSHLTLALSDALPNSLAEAVSADGLTAAFLTGIPNPNGRFFAGSLVEVVDLTSGNHLLTFGGLAEFWASFLSLSPSGRYIAALRLDEILQQRGLVIRDLRDESITEVPYQTPQMPVIDFTTGESLVITRPYNSRSSQVVRWRTGKTNNLRGVYVGSTPDDSKLLFLDGYILGSLFLFAPADGSSNQIAARARYSAISLDGSTIVYSDVSLTPPITSRAIVYDRIQNIYTALGSRPDGVAIDFADTPALSADGRYIAFAGRRNKGGSDDDFLDVYLYDRALTNLTLISRTAQGELPNLPSRSPSISADGRTIAFESLASDLVPDDRNLDFDVFVATITPTDSDHDGLEDGWEWQHFGSLDADPEADADADGISNLDEQRAGTDPNDPASAFHIELIDHSGASELQWTAAIGRRYDVQFTEDISSGDWQSLAGAITALSSQMSLAIAPVGSHARFFRVLTSTGTPTF